MIFNNKGWGLSSLIIFICVLLVAIILITIGAIRLGISSHEDVSNLPVTDVPSEVEPTLDNTAKDYKAQIDNYALQVKDAARSYIDTNNIEIAIDDTINITVAKLVNANEISTFTINGGLCSGYVFVSNYGGENGFYYAPHLICGSDLKYGNYDINLDEPVVTN